MRLHLRGEHRSRLSLIAQMPLRRRQKATEGGFSMMEEAQAGHILYGDTGLTV